MIDAIEIHGLTKRYGQVAALRDVDLTRLPGLITVYGDVKQVSEALRAMPEVAGLQVYDLSLEEIFLAFVAPA